MQRDDAMYTQEFIEIASKFHSDIMGRHVSILTIYKYLSIFNTSGMFKSVMLNPTYEPGLICIRMWQQNYSNFISPNFLNLFLALVKTDFVINKIHNLSKPASIVVKVIPGHTKPPKSFTNLAADTMTEQLSNDDKRQEVFTSYKPMLNGSRSGAEVTLNLDPNLIDTILNAQMALSTTIAESMRQSGYTADDYLQPNVNKVS